jgi:hypothetical protein
VQPGDSWRRYRERDPVVKLAVQWAGHPALIVTKAEELHALLDVIEG